jgi:PleD family two-component response regulator
MTRQQMIDKAKKHGVPDCVFKVGLSKERLQQRIENWFESFITHGR